MPALNDFARRFGSASLFGLALVAALLHSPMPSAPEFADIPRSESPPLPTMKFATDLPAAGAVASTPSLAQLPDGRIAIAWRGSAADGGNTAIWLARLSATGWEAPQPVANREYTGGATFMHVDGVARPQLSANQDGLHLWYETLVPGGGHFIAYARSPDHGDTWQKPARLASSPLVATGRRLSDQPLALRDGGFALTLVGPGQQIEWFHLSPEGRPVGKLHLPLAGAGASLAPSTRHTVVGAATPNRLAAAMLAFSADGGQTWGNQPLQGPILAPTPLALLALPGDRLLLAGNPAEGRNLLRLWLSPDNGASWQVCRDIEGAPDGAASFVEPSLLRGRDGRLHLAYARRQQAIRHVTFTEAWLTEGCR